MNCVCMTAELRQFQHLVVVGLRKYVVSDSPTSQQLHAADNELTGGATLNSHRHCSEQLLAYSPSWCRSMWGVAHLQQVTEALSMTWIPERPQPLTLQSIIRAWLFAKARSPHFLPCSRHCCNTGAALPAVFTASSPLHLYPASSPLLQWFRVVLEAAAAAPALTRCSQSYAAQSGRASSIPIPMHESSRDSTVRSHAPRSIRAGCLGGVLHWPGPGPQPQKTWIKLLAIVHLCATWPRCCRGLCICA